MGLSVTLLTIKISVIGLLLFVLIACRRPEDRTSGITWKYEWDTDDPVARINEKYTPTALPKHGAILFAPAIDRHSTVYLLRPHDYTEPKGLSLVAADDTEQWELRLDGGICNTPAISDDGTIFVGTHEGVAWAIAGDGTKKWSYKFSLASYIPAIDYGGGSTPARSPACSQPAVAQNGATYWAGHGVYAISRDGTQGWAFVPGENFIFMCIGENGTIYALANGGVFALAPDGRQLWRYDLAESEYFVGDIAIGSDGTLYVTTLINSHSALLVLTPQGTLKRRFEGGFAEVLAQPGETRIAADGTIYVTKNVNNRTYAVALDPNGREKWVGPEESDTVAVASDGTLLMREVSELEAVNSGGRVVWNARLPENPDSVDAHDPTQALTLGPEGKLYIGDFYGRIGTLETRVSLATTGWPARFHDARNTSRAGAR